ncbi:multicopper oxidase family protein [Roseovarius aestuariivivens]|uniref:multicopper oxidase family protein n=1 Tax=Roseovarius aestuariivivens TaxID=1888910 RepID=UPI001081D95E|nr:multicopper oxidase family protein [Roseovarius aestuariivivens]
MQLTRRAFLGGAAAAPVLARAPLASETPAQVLRAAPVSVQLAPSDFPKTDLWAFNGTVPGETLRLRQGEMFRARLENGLEQETTIHWHGQRLPNAMDGVPYMTQAGVLPGESFDYAFPLRDAGTFWYHPHANSLEQISRGLAGVMIVEEPQGPDVDGEEVLVFDDWRLDEGAQIHHSFGNRHDMSHDGRLGNYITVNARPELTGEQVSGARLRLRLVNTATARIFRLRFQGLRAWEAALDAMPLETPAETTELVLAPAQRADLFVDITAAPGEEAMIASVERDGTYAMVTWTASGPAQAPRPAPAPLPPNDMPVVSPDTARRQPLTLEGGAMRGLPEQAVWKGEKQAARTLIEGGQFWLFNGVAGMPDAPLLDASLGETIRIPITNRTAFPHAMHLHGMHFREIAADGALGPWRDTLLVAADETREIVFVADNPGDWMFHCHMAAHQMSGMMNWIRVT